ncbi:acyl carrier protein [Halodesulfovibrio aestuarii]|uniref:acyl carrier protein n=1 Tax=Halodesulfovibrio aestuarii TaxID=126333 RepID=UPI00146F1A2C|nr:acyl carrier protein [Halodesulfovibrio aestuarii]
MLRNLQHVGIIVILNERIKKLVEELTFKKVSIDEPLYTSNLIDSMGTVDLALMLEDEFNIKIGTEDIIEPNFDSIEKLTNYITNRIS